MNKQTVYKENPVMFGNNYFTFLEGVKVTRLPNPLELIDCPVSFAVQLFFQYNPRLLGKCYPTFSFLLENNMNFMPLDLNHTFRQYINHLKTVRRISLSIIAASEPVIDIDFNQLLTNKPIMKPELEKLQEIVIDELAETAYMNVTEAITADSKLEDMALDSLDTVELLMRVEKRLSIKINDNDFDSEIKRMNVAQFTEWIYQRIID